VTFDELGVKFNVTECETGWTAVPDREIITVALAALLAILTLPFSVAEAAGAKVTFITAEFPADKIRAEETPPILTPAPESVTFEMETLVPPVLVSVTGRMQLPPTTMFP